MAAMDQAPLDNAAILAAEPAPSPPASGEALKRKASSQRESSPGLSKRQRHDADGAAAERRPSLHDETRPQESESSFNPERRKSATQEEKKRGRRLFGGMLSTISQASPNGSQQQQRRHEIERRQQERQRKQEAEDDQLRAKTLSQLHDVRMAEEIVFEEQVMKSKHAKMLSLAHYLKTRAEPPIYYLPLKRTAGQDDAIEEQISRARRTMEREAAEFRVRKQQHIERYGPSSRGDPTRESPGQKEDDQGPVQEPPAEQPAASEENVEKAESHVKDDFRDAHDESGDVLVEGDEDMVIY